MNCFMVSVGLSVMKFVADFVQKWKATSPSPVAGGGAVVVVVGAVVVVVDAVVVVVGAVVVVVDVVVPWPGRWWAPAGEVTASTDTNASAATTPRNLVVMVVSVGAARTHPRRMPTTRNAEEAGPAKADLLDTGGDGSHAMSWRLYRFAP